MKDVNEESTPMNTKQKAVTGEFNDRIEGNVSRWKVRLEKHRSTWYYFTENPQGGGFGNNYCGPKHIALARAIANIPDGEAYTVNGARFVRRTSIQ